MENIICTQLELLCSLWESDIVSDNLEVCSGSNAHISSVQYLVSNDFSCFVPALHNEAIPRYREIVDDLSFQVVKSSASCIECIVHIIRVCPRYFPISCLEFLCKIPSTLCSCLVKFSNTRYNVRVVSRHVVVSLESCCDVSVLVVCFPVWRYPPS